MQATLQIQGWQTTTKETLIHLQLMAAWITVQNVVIRNMHKVLPAQQRNIFARLVGNMDTLLLKAPNIGHMKSLLRWKIIVNLK